MNIYDYIPRDEYITRDELVRMTGMSDRAIRDEINRLRKDPATIVISSSQKKGYKRPSSKDELMICLNESKSRVSDELQKQIVLSRAIASWTDDGIQPSLF